MDPRLQELMQAAVGAERSLAARTRLAAAVDLALTLGDQETLEKLAIMVARVQAVGDPFTSSREYLEAELDHYKLQLKRVLKAAGHDLGEHVTDTWVTTDEIKGTFAGTVGAPWDEVHASRKRLDARLSLTLQSGLQIPAASLASAFGLDDLDWEILIALLAPAARIDLERLSRAAWRDFTVHYPSAGFLGELLRPTTAGREQVLLRLSHHGPLRRHALVREMSKVPTSPVHETFQLDPDVAAYLHLGTPRGSLALSGLARVDVPPVVRLGDIASPPAAMKAALVNRVREAGARIVLAGATGVGKRSLARAVAAELGAPLLEVDLYLVFEEPARLIEVVAVALRDARLRGAMLYFDGRAFWDDAPMAARVERIVALLDGHPNAILFGSRMPSPRLRQSITGATEVGLESLHPDVQPKCWASALASMGFSGPEAGELRGWVCQAGLTPGIIERAAAEAVARARLARAETHEVSLDDLRDAMRTHVANGISGVATRVPTVFTWDDVILPTEVREQVQEALDYAKYQDVVMNDWGFRSKLPYGRSLSILFTGPPGTGKTMVAGVIARSLGRDLYRIDVASIVSKYIGETEKNLARVFDEAQNSQAVILFDEADSLFGKRTEVKTSIDRYSNLEVNYLLQRIEDYPGIAILTTNFPKNIDEAFKRRLRFIIDFPQPEADTRKRLWQSMIPDSAHVAPDLPFDELAERFDMAGGHIKNAVLKAAFIAAAHGRSLDGPALLRAAYFVCVGTGKLIHSFEPPNADGTQPERTNRQQFSPEVSEHFLESSLTDVEYEVLPAGSRPLIQEFPFPPRKDK